MHMKSGSLESFNNLSATKNMQLYQDVQQLSVDLDILGKLLLLLASTIRPTEVTAVLQPCYV